MRNAHRVLTKYGDRDFDRTLFQQLGTCLYEKVVSF
jgi:hypothetical protein